MFPVRRVERSSVQAYLSDGSRHTTRGITLYTRPTDRIEVGFLIRRRAGSAVQRNRTRRLFWGILNNGQIALEPGLGYIFLFHRHFLRSEGLRDALSRLLKRLH